METQNEMTVEATLSGSAAKLLLHLLRIGVGQRTTAELMRGAGIGNRETFYAAKAQLVEFGLWENPTALFGNPTPLSIFPTPLSEIPTPVSGFPTPTDGKVDTPVRITDSTVWFPDTVATGTITWPSADPGHRYPSGVFTPKQFDEQVPAEDRNFFEVSEKTARELCQEADLMDRDGDRQRPTSSFQARRNAQVKAICLGWSALFPEQNPLTTARAKQLLLVTDDVAEDVYDALEEAVGKEYPFGYAKKVLESKPKPATSDGRDHTGEKMDWTPEMEAKTRAGEEKMRKMGLPARWFGGEE